MTDSINDNTRFLNIATGEFISDGLIICLPWKFEEDILDIEAFQKGGSLFRFSEHSHNKISTLTHELLHYYHFTTTAVGLAYLLTCNHISSTGFQILQESDTKFDGRPLVDAGIEPSFESNSLEEEWRIFRRNGRYLMGEIPESQGNWYTGLTVFWWRELHECGDWAKVQSKITDLKRLEVANPQRPKLSTTQPFVKQKSMTGLDLFEGYARTMEFENRWVYGVDANVRDFNFLLSSMAGRYSIAAMEFWYHAGRVFGLTYPADVTQVPRPEEWANFLTNLSLALELSLMAPVHPVLVRARKKPFNWGEIDPINRFYLIAKALATGRVMPIKFEDRNSTKCSGRLDDWCKALGWRPYSDSLQTLYRDAPTYVLSKDLQERTRLLVERKLRVGLDVELDDLIYELTAMEPRAIILTTDGCLGMGLESVRNELWKSLMVFLKAEIANFALVGRESLRISRLQPVLAPLQGQLKTLFKLVRDIVPSIGQFKTCFLPETGRGSEGDYNEIDNIK